jgi:uncharacterized membrane protein
MRPGPLIMLIVGIVLTLIGAVLTVGGAAAAVAHSAQGRDGYFSSPAEVLSTDSYAMINRFDAAATTSPPPSGPIDLDLASLRLTATSTTGDAVFIGIAPTAQVDGYLAGVHHTEVRDIQTTPFRVRYLDVPGQNRPAPPAAQEFWIESASGAGEQSITTSWQSGDHSVVVMNADASRAVSVEVRGGVRIGFLAPVATALLAVGIGTVLAGLLLLILGIVGLARGSSPNRPGQPVGAAGRYPAG